MVARNSYGGKGQPCGTLDLEAWREQGWYGCSLLNYQEMLNDPIAEEHMLELWIRAKIYLGRKRRRLKEAG